MVKHRPLIYKKCEKTFEILRSEITFLMDLYVQTVPQNIYQHKFCSSFWSQDFEASSK